MSTILKVYGKTISSISHIFKFPKSTIEKIYGSNVPTGGGGGWVPVVGWNDITSDFFWGGTGTTRITWDGTKWTTDFNSTPKLYVADGSTWQVGFRPSQMRITIGSGGLLVCRLVDTDLNNVVNDFQSWNVGVFTKVCNWSNNFDMDYFNIDARAAITTITKIEALYP